MSQLLAAKGCNGKLNTTTHCQSLSFVG